MSKTSPFPKYETVNDALINGDPDYAQYLINTGCEWVGSKKDADQISWKYPNDATMFAKTLKMVLDLGLCDSNDDEYIPFVWFLRPARFKRDSKSALLQVIEQIYAKSLTLHYLHKDVNSDVCYPQIKIGCTDNETYLIVIEDYVLMNLMGKDGEVFKTFADSKQIIEIFESIFGQDFGTC